MDLEYEDYKFAKNIVNESLKIDDDDDEIESHIQNSIKHFIDGMDASDYEVRNKIFLFLQYISTCYLNYYLNGNLYFLSEEEIEKSHKGREVIGNFVDDFRSSLNK